MELESIKTILFYLTLLVLLYNIFFSKVANQLIQLFLVSSTFITILLILVIELQIHHLLRSKFKIPNTLTYIIMVIPICLHFYKFRNLILKSNFVYLLLSLLFIGFALLLDLLTDAKILIMSSSDSIEEILRILGAFFWLLYYIFYSYRLKRN